MHCHLKTGVAPAFLFASAVALADDTDVDLFGPTTRSSVVLLEQARTYRASEVDAQGGGLLGKTTSRPAAA